MANKQRGYVEVELDKPRKFKFDMNALVELEDALGIKMAQLNDENMGMKELRAMIWAGLLHAEPDLTVREVGEWIDLDRMEEITEKVTEALQLAFGGGNKGKNVKGGLNGTGQTRSA